MPPIKLTEVLSFSSEDVNHPADNLLRGDALRKWRCAAGTTDRQSSVILKLERLTSLSSIDIGNDGSAFIEVLVGREGVADFQVLLVASSFMTPIESRNGTDLHRVRMFGPDKLNKSVAEQKWDRVKVICTQPFNRNTQYGLSFITIRVPDKPGESQALPHTPKITKLGSFTLRDDDDDDPISVGSVFAKHKDKQPQVPLSGAAAIRAASVAAATASNSSPTTQSIKKTDSTQPYATAHKRKADDSPQHHHSYQLNKKFSADESSRERKTDERGKDNNSKQERKADLERKNSDRGEKRYKNERERKRGEGSINEGNKERKRGGGGATAEGNTKREGSMNEKDTRKGGGEGSTNETKNKKAIKSRPFCELMDGVVFVLSGYQNPQRSNLRDAMMDMGAVYKSDWGPTCTHLVCAFKNTPKYQQVQLSKGRIVSGSWITQCHKDKKRYPCKRYELDTKSQGEEEEEVWAEELLPKSSKSPQQHTPSSKPMDIKEEEKEDVYGDETDMSDNEDTDDEIERAKSRKPNDTPVATTTTHTKERTPGGSGDSSRKTTVKRKEEQTVNRETTVRRKDTSTRVNGGGLMTPKNESDFTDDEVYDDDTDVDEENGEHLVTTTDLPDTSSLPLPSLGDYFSGKHFLLYGNMGDDQRRLLNRYITAFLGEVENYMSDKVHFVISEDAWDRNFEEALNEHPSLQFVRPLWVWRCCDKQRLLPHQPYLIVPKE
ncbi:hypothetical protein Pmani_001161 [Petrolisthes manimaculis]|uniref:DNA repair protein XRCC1 n=1 Tax=Petrolisthes manimaculis TaxID=1843537 RepID=A0AAE1UKJ7_9EUCA|nr:hypothetical protein Pmani_001161 [Petrolisthes manimaculis]